jgi:hypothetical protein
VIALQRAAGNAAVRSLLQRTACGCGSNSGCSCSSDGSVEETTGEQASALPAFLVNEDLRGTVMRLQREQQPVVQRQQQDPADLTGTPFEALDGQLKTKLKDKSVFDWGGAPTLAEALGKLANATIASMARVGASISASAPFLWNHVQKIGGGWITDNFGIGVQWSNPGGLAGKLAADPGWCRDNPITALKYHGSTDAFRQVPGSPGAASLHVITSGKTDVHIDAHQPIEGKETDWPWTGQCNYDLSAWWDHAGDVMAGGGATGTAVGRFAKARDNINKARDSVYYSKSSHGPRLDEATQHLDSIMFVVQKYAAMGAMVGNEWEGDKRMLQDKATMGKLEQAEELIRAVEIEQLQEEAKSRSL